MEFRSCLPTFLKLGPIAPFLRLEFPAMALHFEPTLKHIMKFAFTLSVLLATLLFCHHPLPAQTWTAAGAPYSQRYDDIYFVNADHGWAISPYDAWAGELGWIIETTDGGDTWNTIVDSSGLMYRAMGFFNADHGFIGNLESGLSPADTAVMVETTDGGQTWNPVQGLPGPRPNGVCGIHVHDDSLMYASGRYYGPAGMYKTSDQGGSWSYTNLDSLAGGLVDTYFWSADSGITIGSSGVDIFDSAGVILRTYNGGQSWERAYVTPYDQAICWKISFPSRNIGYVSVQSFNNSNPKNFIKTTDGGATWFEDPYFTSTYSAQGIGFISDTLGWIGGHYQGSGNFVTTNSGQSWTQYPWGERVNRFRFVSDSIGFAAGRDIYKLSLLPTSLDEGLPKLLKVGPLTPNPITGSSALHLQLPHETTVELSIHSTLGALVWQGKPEGLPAGEHHLPIPTFEESPGVYFLVVRGPDWTETIKMVKD